VSDADEATRGRRFHRSIASSSLTSLAMNVADLDRERCQLDTCYALYSPSPHSQNR
jgi:hypothetical protein